MAAEAPSTPIKATYDDENSLNAAEDRDKISPLPLQSSTRHNQKRLEWKRYTKAPRFRADHTQKASASAGSNVTKTSNKEGTNFSIQQLCQLRVRQRNICYVVGLPQTMKKEELKAMQWFGRFGKINYISLIPHLFDSGNMNGVYIRYLSELSAANAIEFANSCIFNDGRKLTATHGTQRFCYSLILGQSCTDSSCRYLHHWVDVKHLLNDHEVNTLHAMQYIPSTVAGVNRVHLFDSSNIQSQLVQLQQNQIELLQIQVASQSQEILKWKGLYEMLMVPFNAMDEKYKKLKSEFDELKATNDAAAAPSVKQEVYVKIKEEQK